MEQQTSTQLVIYGTDAFRISDDLDNSVDQENAPHHDLAIPKKRNKANTAKITAMAATSAADTTTINSKPAQHLAAGLILSPKSSNARTIPGSPFRAAMASPFKSKLAAPYTSPIRPAVNATTTRTAGTAARNLNATFEKAKPARAKTTRKVTPGTKTKATTTTTITTLAAAPAPAPTAAAKGKRGVQVSVSETVVKKKVTASKKAEPPPTAERRVLRKRV